MSNYKKHVLQSYITIQRTKVRNQSFQYLIKIFFNWDRSFSSTFAKFSEKLTFFTP